MTNKTSVLTLCIKRTDHKIFHSLNFVILPLFTTSFHLILMPYSDVASYRSVDSALQGVCIVDLVFLVPLS